METKNTLITEIADVTPEIIDEAYEVATGYYVNKGERIDWADVWDRLEFGTDRDFGTKTDTPAMRKIQREVRKRISE